MKRNFVSCAGIVTAALLGVGAAGVSGIFGSRHDFSGKSWMPQGQVCVICHAPHNARSAPSTTDAGLIWNHQITPAIFRPYSSSTLKAIVGQPDGASRLCLSCHDGAVMLNAFGDLSGSEMCGKIIGADLSRVHPLSFVYDDALAAATTHLKPPSATPSGFGGTIAQDLLRGNKMQCVSCHEPHNRFNNPKFLRMQNGRDGLCGICHKSQPPGSINMGGW